MGLKPDSPPPKPTLLIMHCAGSLCRKGMVGSYNFNMIIGEGPADKETLSKAPKEAREKVRWTYREGFQVETTASTKAGRRESFIYLVLAEGGRENKGEEENLHRVKCAGLNCTVCWVLMNAPTHVTYQHHVHFDGKANKIWYSVWGKEMTWGLWPTP